MTHIIHISDTHIGPTKDFELFGVNTYAAAQKLIEEIHTLPIEPDIVLHSGDIVADASEASHQLAAEVFSKFKFPIFYVTGNHDRSCYINKYLTMGNHTKLTMDEDSLVYKVKLKAHDLIVLDGRGPDEIDPSGLLPEEQFSILEREIEEARRPFCVAIHFPPLKLDSAWLDKDMRLINGDKLHATLLRAGSRLRGVFFGHLHRGIKIYKDGIFYSCVGSSFCQFSAWPKDQGPSFEQNQACFNHVTLLDDSTLVKEYSLNS